MQERHGGQEQANRDGWYALQRLQVGEECYTATQDKNQNFSGQFAGRLSVQSKT